MHLGASGSRCKLSNLLEWINNKIKLQEILTQKDSSENQTIINKKKAIVSRKGVALPKSFNQFFLFLMAANTLLTTIYWCQEPR